MEKLTDKIRFMMEKIMFVAAGGVAIFYAASVILLITGIGINKEQYGLLLGFSLLSAFATIMIKNLIGGQGTKEAAKIPENKVVVAEYTKLSNKRIKKPKKLKTIGKIKFKKIANDILFKGLGILVGMSGMLYIAIDGNGQ